MCGKGVGAAVVTSLARYSMRAVAVRADQPSDVLSALNATLLGSQDGRALTAAFARFRSQDGQWCVDLACAGHPLPLLRRDGVRAVGVPGTMLGVVPQPALTDATVPLAAGDLLVFYTDGVSEGRRDGDFYGDEQVAALLAEHTGDARSFAEALLADVLAF